MWQLALVKTSGFPLLLSRIGKLASICEHTKWQAKTKLSLDAQEQNLQIL